MKVTCNVENADALKKVRGQLGQIQQIVLTHAEKVAALARAKAPVKNGDLRKGIVASPWEEKSRYAYKIGREVYMDYGMNDTFVKMSKNGKRYYYPASQEFGFRVHTARGTRKITGKYFMRDAAESGSAAFFSDMEDFVEKVVSE